MSEQAEFIPAKSPPAPQRHRGAGGEDLQPLYSLTLVLVDGYDEGWSFVPLRTPI